MKNFVSTFLFFSVLSLCLFSCSKENSAVDTVNYDEILVVSAKISFQIGDQTYVADRVESAGDQIQNANICAHSNNPCNLGEDYRTNAWTRYIPSDNALSIMRQDDADRPNFRIEFKAFVDLTSIELPYTVDNAVVAVRSYSDYVFPTGDITASYFEGSKDEDVVFKITELSGQNIKGTFSGNLVAENGAYFFVENGIFSSTLTEY